MGLSSIFIDRPGPIRAFFEQNWPKALSLPDSMLRWQPGVTPLSTVPSIATAIAIYLGVVLGGQELMR